MSDEFRAEFPVTENWAFLNHASVAPISRRAHDRLVRWAQDVTEHGNVHEGDWWREVEQVRQDAARLLGTQASQIAFLKNTSEGLALVAEGFPWREGDNVVQAAGEFPANVYPWMHLTRRGVALKTVPLHDGTRIRIEDLAAAIDERTRILALSFVQFASGFRSDLAALAELCRERGIDLCVDAIQGLGVLPVDVEAMGIHYLAADGHKWLLAPEGAAIFYIRQDRLDTIRPTSVGWRSVAGWTDYDRIDFRLRPDAQRFEGGTANTPGILGLGASLSLLLEVGIPTIAQRVRALTDYLIGRLEEAGASVHSPRGDSEWSGIVSFSVPGQDPRELVRQCRRAKVVISARGGRLRASPHFYNDMRDIDRLLEVCTTH